MQTGLYRRENFKHYQLVEKHLAVCIPVNFTDEANHSLDTLMGSAGSFDDSIF